MELARIGATAKGGVCRLAASDLDGEARRLFIRWCEEAGCTVSVDRIGNIFARRPGRNPALPPVMAGSHLDTQPTGGRFDGAYGVMAGLELVRTLNDLGYETEAPVEIVAWTNEEGSRFSPAMVGSGAFTGVFDLKTAVATRYNNARALTLGGELERSGFVEVSPNSRNTIPGRVFLTVDFRHPEDAVLTAMDKELREACAAAAATQKLEVEVKEFWYFPPTPFEPQLVGKVREAAAEQGLPHQNIISGAGHDAVYMARVAPTAMIFVPCVGGISHNEIEDGNPDDLTAGC